MGHAERQREICGSDLSSTLCGAWRGGPSLLWKKLRMQEDGQSFTSLARRMRKRLNFKTLHSFKKAPRFYGNRKCLKWGYFRGFNTIPR
jgi:hypothetical protein